MPAPFLHRSGAHGLKLPPSGVVHRSMKKSTEEDKLGELLVNAMKDMAIISYAILECSTDGQYIEVLILTQSSMVYLVKARVFGMSGIPGIPGL